MARGPRRHLMRPCRNSVGLARHGRHIEAPMVLHVSRRLSMQSWLPFLAAGFARLCGNITLPIGPAVARGRCRNLILRCRYSAAFGQRGRKMDSPMTFQVALCLSMPSSPPTPTPVFSRPGDNIASPTELAVARGRCRNLINRCRDAAAFAGHGR